MYLRAVHAEHDIPTLHAFIRANPLGIFTTAIDSASHPFLQSSHIPWILDLPENASETDLGTLRGHMARANPQVKAMIAELTSSAPSTSSAPQSERESASETHAQKPRTRGHTLARDVLVLFNGPAHHYVTPKFYTETKPSTGKVVPTWDYAAVQVYGRARVYFDWADGGETDAFLSRAVRDLSRFAETEVMGYAEPWAVEDAPEGYVELLKKAIVGVEVEIGEMGGKWKMSQEMGGGDRLGVVEGFEGLGSEVGRCMAQIIRQRAQLTGKKQV